MNARTGLRIGVVGATGGLGTELLELLDQSSLRVSEIVPIATDDSLGREIEFQGSSFPVEVDDARLTGLDLVFLCVPPGIALDFVRRALHERVPCIDLSGATAGLPVGGAGAEVCLVSGLSGSSTVPANAPAPGSALWYIVRGRNVCGAGTYGNTSDGTPRTSTTCP